MSRLRARAMSGTLGVSAAVGLLVLIAFALPAVGAPSIGGVTPFTSKGPCATGALPGIPGWNPVKHWMYVPNELSGNITVLSGTCHLVGTIALPSGAEPIAIAFDPANNWMYATDDGNNVVYGIAGLTVTATISSSEITAPIDIIWDPGDSMLLVTNDYGAYTVVGISGTSVVGSVGVGDTPQGLCYDPYYNTILVVNRFGSNVTILSAYSPLLPSTSSAGTGFDPRYCVFDPSDNLDYITNEGDDNLTVMTGNGLLVTNVAVGSLPTAIGWDQATLQVFVGNSLHGSISVVSGFSVVKTIKAKAASPQGFAYDEATDTMYVTSGTKDLAYIET